MLKKLRKMATDIKGSETVEKILMVVTSVIIGGLGVTYLYKVINAAVKDANGDTDAIKKATEGESGNSGSSGGGNREHTGSSSM